VLTHAIMDAILGALSLGDISILSPTEPEWAADSLVLLGKVHQLVRDKGGRWEILIPW